MRKKSIDEIMKELAPVWQPGFQFLDDPFSPFRVMYKMGKENTRQMLLDAMVRADRQMAMWLSHGNCRKMFKIVRKRMVRCRFKKPLVIQ